MSQIVGSALANDPLPRYPLDGRAPTRNAEEVHK